ncbi:MAG: CDGSH iron-sulfur domain-containing protein [Proteobacteria bacterium]|nr:CDGSH iron-sulfur domain-containing protein [Pseudomonadota bacterium]
MSDAIIAQKSPIAEELVAGKRYFWCACGRSKSQPFCDGSHKGTGFSPIKFEATDSKKVFFCCCKQTCNPPFCDGTHNSI